MRIESGSRAPIAEVAPSTAAARPLLAQTVIAITAVAGISLLAYLCSSFGLFALNPEFVTPLFIGAMTGVAAGASWRRAAAGTAIGLALGLLVAAPWFLGHLVPALDSKVLSGGLFVLLGSLAAGTMAYCLERVAWRKRAEWMAAIALVAVILGATWVTTGTVNAGAFTGTANSLDGVLSVRPELGNTPEDHDYYLRLFYDIHDRQPYYESVAKIWLADPNGGNGLPIGVTSYRLPTIFYLWRLLPPEGDAIPRAFLGFAVLAVAAGFSIGAQLARPGVAVLGALMVAVAYLLIATTTWVTFVDGWAMAFTLLGIALFIASVTRGSRSLLWAAVGAFFVGAALRELLTYPMVLGIASVLLLPREERWREARPWLVGLTAFVAVYAAHIVAIAGRVSPRIGYSYWLQGGVSHVLATLQFLAPYFGGGPWFVPALVAAGLFGAVTVWVRQRRLSAFLTTVVATPLVAFAFFGNGGQELSSGAVSGYWGILVVPIALTLVPVAIDRTMAALGMVRA